MTKTTPIAMALDYANAAYNAEMRPGAGNEDSLSIAPPSDPSIRRYAELLAAEAMGTVGPAAQEEMHMLEDQFRAEM